MSGQDGDDTSTNAQLLPVLLESVPNKHTISDWHDSAAIYIRQDIFDKKQFATDDDLRFGGMIQKLVCKELSVCGDLRARVFWDDEGGKITVRNTFRRKRQAAQNAMKIAFRGKYREKSGTLDSQILTTFQPKYKQSG
jgi:hypothetical protein